MPRPRSLTLPAIAAAALAVVDREGVGALSMRSVAAELRIGTMSLYRYVESRDELERAIVELALAQVSLDLPAATTWDDGILLVLGRVRGAVGGHPAIVPLLVAHRHLAAGTVHFAEALLGLLTTGGFDGERRVIAFRTLLSFTLGSLQYQNLGALGGSGTATLAQLPPAEFPLLAATAQSARNVSPDDEFFGGLRAILSGLRAMTATGPPSRGS